jgi:hypothetical protein
MPHASVKDFEKPYLPGSHKCRSFCELVLVEAAIRLAVAMWNGRQARPDPTRLRA